VPTEANGRAGRGRPADPGIERRVLAAALTVYGEVGWAGFTLDRVARRAPVGKAALYRRWPTKEDLLLAALEHLAEPPGDEADPTDLRLTRGMELTHVPVPRQIGLGYRVRG